jgi:hypothetical protein
LTLAQLRQPTKIDINQYSGWATRDAMVERVADLNSSGVAKISHADKFKESGKQFLFFLFQTT